MTVDNSGAQSHMIDLPSGRFHYLSWGTEHSEHPGALLLHGITSSALSWVHVGPALADRYRVYALDMRGHGDSFKPPAGAYSLRETADDALALIAALGLERPVLMGHSWGGATALALASGFETEQPAPTFSKIILEDPACNFGQGDAEQRAASYVKDIGRPADELLPELTAENPNWSLADIEGKIDALGKVSREAVISVFEQGGQTGSLLPLLGKLNGPTLLLRADPDLGTTLPGSAWDEARSYLLPPSQAVQIDGATHNMHRTRFDAFMRIVNDFLRT